MSLVADAWTVTVPPESVDAERWVVLPLDNGRALVRDMLRGEHHTERNMREAHLFVAAARQAARERRARAAAEAQP